MTQTINLSLNQGYVPASWESALLKPILEKPGLESQYENFRPVSNLQFVSKIVE